jgi:hypothetical protein
MWHHVIRLGFRLIMEGKFYLQPPDKRNFELTVYFFWCTKFWSIIAVTIRKLMFD